MNYLIERHHTRIALISTGMHSSHEERNRAKQNDDVSGTICISEMTELSDFGSNKLLNVKLPILSSEKMAELKKIDGVKILNQTNNKEAKQEREKGFCECIIVDENELKLEQTFEKIKIICTNSSTG